MISKQLFQQTYFTFLIIIFSFTTTIPLIAQDEPVDSDSTEKKISNGDLPLEAGRTFSFDVNEGSWISLDVSPDGETIVFDFLGDLYTLPISGGEATQITEGMQFDSQPRFQSGWEKSSIYF